MNREEKLLQSSLKDTGPSHEGTTDTESLSTGLLPRKDAAQSTITPEADNSPRRGYTPGVPASYRAFRNHTLGHLRRHISLEELLGARWGDFSWSQDEVSLGRRTFTNNRTIAEVFESFLERRRELASAIPSLNEPGAFLFPALDGGALFVSHRPRGVSLDGLNEFVSSRNLLFGFLYKTIREKDLAYFVDMNIHELAAARKRLEKNSSVHARLEPLVVDYLAAKEKWVSNLKTLTDALHDSGGTKGLDTLIATLEETELLSPNDQVRLCELRELKTSLEQEIQRQYEVKVRFNRSKSSRPNGGEEQDSAEPGDGEISSHHTPVYAPNPRLVFLGTDGGALFGDTGQTCYKH